MYTVLSSNYRLVLASISECLFSHGNVEGKNIIAVKQPMLIEVTNKLTTYNEYFHILAEFIIKIIVHAEACGSNLSQ